MGGIGRSVGLIEKDKNIGVVENIRRCVQLEEGKTKDDIKWCYKDYEGNEVCGFEVDRIETQMDVKIPNGEIISAVSYGSDNWISPYVKKGDRVALGRADTYSAEWISLDGVKLGYDHDTIKPCREGGKVGI